MNSSFLMRRFEPASIGTGKQVEFFNNFTLSYLWVACLYGKNSHSDRQTDRQGNAYNRMCKFGEMKRMLTWPQYLRERVEVLPLIQNSGHNSQRASDVDAVESAWLHVHLLPHWPPCLVRTVCRPLFALYTTIMWLYLQTLSVKREEKF